MSTTKRVVKRKKQTVTWEVDQYVKDCVLVPFDDPDVETSRTVDYPLVDTRVLAGTKYRLNTKTNSVVSMVTQMPGGLNAGWDMCGRCKLYLMECTCKDGLYHPQSIAWMKWFESVPFDPSRHTLSTDYMHLFDPWKQLDENGRPRKERDGLLHTTLPKKAAATVAPVAKSKPTKSIAPKSRPRRNMMGEVESTEPEVDLSTVSSTELDKQAAVDAAATVAAARKAIKGTRKKVVRRK